MNLKEKILNIKNRGLIKEETDLEKLIELIKEKKTVYCGIDPSCDSLHIGHLVPLKLVKELYDLGCKVIILIGSTTVRIGDPSFRKTKRKKIDFEIIKKNIGNIKKQIKILIPKAKILENNQWYKDMSIIDFFDKVGNLFTINKMLERKSIKESLQNGILFYGNFSYILMQAYDFYYLWKNYNVSIQVGGSDQFPNIIFGIEMINKLENKKINNVVGLTTPLLEKSNGEKFSKTDNDNIWIDPNKTRFYDLFQFIFNISDEDIKIWKNIFLPYEINYKSEKHRNLQKKIAFYLINWISNDNLIEEKIKNVLNLLQNNKNLENIDFNKLKEILGFIEVKDNTTLINIMVKNSIFKSISDARRNILQGGIKIFNKKIIDINYKIKKTSNEIQYFLLKKGKNNWYILKVI